MMTLLRRGALVAAMLLGAAGPALGQFGAFGRNKVQYRQFDWQMLRGPHIDLYFYESERELAPVALSYAEESYQFLSLKFGHTVASRIPLIVYASHTDFEQTNVLPFTPPEGLLGVTDFLKRRVTLPFRGNLAEFRHTLRHELVHVFQLSLALDRYNRSPRSANMPIPLWWTEGLAEYWSGGEDARDEMILRDLVLTGRFPDLERMAYLQGGIVYPLGGRIHRWLAETYGDWRVAQLYQDAWRYENFEAAIQGVYGKPLSQLNEEFQYAMRRSYYPTSSTHAPLSVVARRVARAAIKPAYAGPDSAQGGLFYFSYVNGYVTIYRRSLDGGDQHEVVTAGRSPAFESLHPFESRVDVSRPGYLLFTTKYRERDALIIWDLEKGKLAGRYQFPALANILSPAWLPDGRSIVFSGLAESGVSNLYRLQLATGSLERVTDDVYQDLDPSPSPDGRWIVFASDRTAGGLEGAVNLFLRDMSTGAIRQLTSGAWVDEAPRWAPDGRIYFASDRDGVLNVFSVDTSGVGRRETSAWTGAFDPATVPDRSGLLVGGFNELTLGVYYYPRDSVAQSDSFALASRLPPHSEWSWPASPPYEPAVLASQPYRRKYQVDFLAGEAFIIPRVGGAQGITMFMSDMLSDNIVFLNLSSYQGRNFGSVFENVNAAALYLNQTRRLNWGVGVFRSKGNNYEGDFTPSYTENTVGGLGVLRYPLSSFDRLEGEMVVEHSNRLDLTLPVDEPRRIGWIASHYLGFVHDNSLWVSTGPIDGTRFGITAGVSNDFSNARFDSYLVTADLRKYFRLGQRSAFAVRAMGFGSGGDRPQRINIGGTLGLRGYPLYGYIVGSRAFMLNTELRFPILDHFDLGFPFGNARFPEIHGAIFGDLGRAWYPGVADPALLGSYGVSFRWPLVPGIVLRLDWGRRFSDGSFAGYGLTESQKRKGFVQFFFGYNY